MKRSGPRRRAASCLHLLGLWLAVAFAGPGCDEFFDIRGVLSDCYTGERIAGAQGVAVAAGFSGQTLFTTDAAGVFAIHMNAPRQANVTVVISKPGYVDLTVMYQGVPADAEHIELCLTRAP
jgi:hypothetical protein